MPDLRLPFDDGAGQGEAAEDRRDRQARERAVDPRYNVALEASAGTGKTRVLVDRYVNLLRAGVDPGNILAMTFTRKAAAEMRERILGTLRTLADRKEIPPARWRELRDRTGDIAISTIDAFCLSLLREFPLEADLDPGFTVADDTAVPRLVDESLDRALRVCRAVAKEDEHVALVFAQLGDRRARTGLAALLSRRLVAPAVLSRYLARSRPGLTVEGAAERAARALLDLFEAMGDDHDDGFLRFVTSGPADPAFMLLVRHIESLDAHVRTGAPIDPARVQVTIQRSRDYFLTREGKPRTRLSHSKTLFPSPAHWRTHRDIVVNHAPRLAEALAAYRRDLNVLVSRGVWRMFRIAEAEYRRTLDAHAVLDFSDLLQRTLDLLRNMEEFARSRYRLESRYHHVLVDEFQDTSRAQWELIALLVQAWGQGAGLAHSGPLPPSIFIVGDRKQSIYRFRDADVSVLQDAIRHLQQLRPDGDVHRSISRSFRSVPAILGFVNDVCRDVEKAPDRPDAFQYGEEDAFPIDASAGAAGAALGVVVAEGADASAEATADEIARLLSSGATIRDIGTGVARTVRAGDIGVLFRTRESHRELEDALERRRIPAYVYKGLGFFDADEVRDVLALLWHLADPASDLRAAAWLRSGFVRLSDESLRRLAPHVAEAITSAAAPAALDSPDAEALMLARSGSARWRRLADRISAAELLDIALSESAYAAEMKGARFRQARENLKKVRSLVRRVQNAGYATLAGIVSHLDRLAIGDESNAAIDATDAVSLMTVHASKGLEFPVVFLVNLTRGTGRRRSAIRVAPGLRDEDVSVSVGDFESDSDEDQAAVEREETKRLLYVALTRARDRLYLGAVAKDGVVQPGTGSLAEVLPPSLLAALSAACVRSRSNSPDTLRWRSASGGTHSFLVCPPGDSAAVRDRPAGTGLADELADDDDFAPVAAQTTHAGGPVKTPRDSSQPVGGFESSRLIGILVHRLFQHSGWPSAAGLVDSSTIRERVLRLMRPEETAGVADVDRLIDDVVSGYETFGGMTDLRQLYQAGAAAFEVPFTMAMDGRIVHGTIDCLVRSQKTDDCGHPVERVLVLELKTGRARPEHQDQVAMYRQAAALMFPGALVESRLAYLDGMVAS